MGILDEAIREHLDLKRQHGADEPELKKLEDDAFGPPERPGASEAVSDPEAEAPTAFMKQPDLDQGEVAAEPSPQPSSRREPAAGMTDIQEAPEPAADDDEELDDEPADEEQPDDEEQPAGEHETVPEKPIEPAGHSTEERHAIADQPTQMFDVEEDFASTEAPAPPDEDLVAEEISEARLGPAEPIADVDDEEDEDDFFDEQRLSDELDQALEAPVDDEPEAEEDAPPDDDEDDVDPAEEEVVEGKEKAGEPAAEGDDEHDPLEDTPDFLEEAPEDDQLWFEQKPPKDFDFDD